MPVCSLLIDAPPRPDGTDCTSRVLTGPDGLTPTFTAATPGMYTVTLTLSGMTNFKDKTVTTKLFVRQVFAPDITGTPHPGCVLTAELPGVPDDVAARATYTWKQDGTELSSGTGNNTYTPTADKAKGGPITVTVKPADEDTAYIAGASPNIVRLMHNAFNSNGFCTQVLADGTICGEYESATLSNGVYHIANAGQLFWFAAMVNGKSAHAYTVEETHPTISGVLDANIDLLEGNPNAENHHAEWTPIGCEATLSSNVVTAKGFSGTFDGGGKTVTNMYISTASCILGFVGYLAPNGRVTNLTVSGLIAPAGTNRDGNACYFLNGNTSAATVWRQNVDNAAAGNGQTPQAYPNLSSTDGIVYRHTETKYSNTKKVVAVSISWGSMAFTYKAFENGAWDPTTHDDKHAWVAVSNDADAVTVSTSPDTNVDVNATFRFTPEPNFNKTYGLTGTLKNGDSVISSPTTVTAGGGSVTAKLEIASGVIPQDKFSGTQTHIGTVTIGLTTD